MFGAKNKKAQIGKRGEEEAQKYLRHLGYDILCVNFCNYSGRRIGEIDIIAREKDEFVFVEVKSRTVRNNNYPPAEESITSSKLHKLNKIARFYITKNNLWNNPHRFDAVCVYFSDTDPKVSIKHLKSIFL